MKKLVFDIETVGADFDRFDQGLKEYLMNRAEKYRLEHQDEKDLEGLSLEEIAKSRMGLESVFSHIAAIGVMDADTKKGSVYYMDRSIESNSSKDDFFSYIPAAEKDILQKFWKEVAKYKQVITFNGRRFDAPFIHIRSAILGIKPTKNLSPNRYSEEHLDLYDRLTFFGATKGYSLDVWCRVLGIESPKQEASGEMVRSLFDKGRFLDIARYCSKDVLATHELYLRWNEFIKVP